MTTLDNKTAEILGQLQHLAPQATQLAMEAARVEAVSKILENGTGVLVGGIALWLMWRNFKKAVETAEEADDVAVYLGMFFSYLVGGVLFVTGVVCIFCLIDPWVWVTLYHPELWLAHVATARLGGG